MGVKGEFLSFIVLQRLNKCLCLAFTVGPYRFGICISNL